MNLKEAILAFIFFTILTLIFFYKIFFGLIPLPSDIIVGAYWPWHDYKWGYSVGVPVKNPKLSDAVSLYYPFKSLGVDLERKGELPLWNPYMFGGYPLFASSQVGLLFPTMIFYLLFSTPIAWTMQTMSQLLLALFFMYLLLRHLKLPIIPSVFGSVAFGFGGFSTAWMQWNTQATTSLFLPILILFLDKYLITKQVRWGLFLSIFFCFQIFAGYLPIIPFTLMTLGVWYLFRSKNYISDLKILFFVILGISLSAVFSFPVAELIQISQRTVESLEGKLSYFWIENLINLIAPDFYGNHATGNFWGKGDSMDFTIYTGIPTLILAFYGIKNFIRRTEIKFALSIFIIALIISISNPLSNLLYGLGIWGGSSITMNRANFMINFSLAILGAYGLSVIKDKYTSLSLKPVFGVLSVIIFIASGLFALLKYPNISPEVITHINIGLKNLVLPTLLLGSVLLLLLLIKKVKIFRTFTEIVFILILIFDLFRFGLKFNTFSSPDFIYPKTPISDFLQKYPNDRIIAEKDIFPANMWIPFKISSIQGYEGIYPLNIAKLLAVANSGDFNAAPQPRWGVIDSFTSKIIDESNTRFLLAIKRGSQGEVTSSGQISTNIPSKFRKVFEDKGVAVLENTKSLPRVYATKQAIRASDKDTLKMMIDENFPIDKTSITTDFEFHNSSAEELEFNLGYNQITNSHVVINTETNLDSYLVLLDSYYPGWKALMDGKETTIHRTNYNFRGIVLPKGNHTVDFKYQPKSLEYGAVISGVSLLILIFLFFLPRIRKNFN